MALLAPLVFTATPRAGAEEGAAPGSDAAVAFERAATTTDDAVYAVARDTVFRAGDAGAAVAEERIDDPRPAARALAKLVLLRRNDPDGFTERFSALRVSHATTDERAAGAIDVVRGQVAAQGGGWVEIRSRFEARHAVIAIDALRSADVPGAPGNAKVAAAIVRVHRASDAAPWLVRRLVHPEANAAVADALVSLGTAALPPLRDAVAFADPAPRTPWGLVAEAAGVLARIGDRKAVPSLLAHLRSPRDVRTLLGCARALAALDPDAGAPTALDLVATFTEESRRLSGANIDYLDVRDAAQAFGASALAAAEELLAATPDPLAAARLRGIAWEITHPEEAAAAYRAEAVASPGTRWIRAADADPDEEAAAVALHGRRTFWGRTYGEVPPTGAPLALVAERATVEGRTDDLMAVAAGGDAGRAALLRAVLTGPLRHGGGALAVHALAEIDVDAACDVVEAGRVDPAPQDLVERMAALTGHLGTPRVPELLARIADDPDVGRNRGPSAHDAAVRFARDLLGVARGERRPGDLLAHPLPVVQLAVARSLARSGNAEGNAVLAAAALAAEGHIYASLRDDLVASGKAPPAAAGDVKSAVLHAAVADRIAHPARARDVDAAALRHQPRVGHILGPQPSDYEAGGEHLARDVGPAARSLLEERAVFLQDRVSIHALGVLGDDRSIPALTFVARSLHAPAASALQRMGETGLAAARALPPADPVKAEFGARATRHVAAAEALDGTPEGIEKALAGLAEPVPSARSGRDAWTARMQRYLELLAPTGDPRVVEPALRLLDAAAPDDARLADAALVAMEKVHDPRVVEACLRRLPAHMFDEEIRDWSAAPHVLRTQLGDRTVATLAETFARTPAGRSRNALAHAMYTSATDRAGRDLAAAALRVQTGEQDSKLAAGAAFDLVRLHFGRPQDERSPADLEALLAFVRSHADPGLTADELAKHAAPGAGDALLACYLLGGNTRAAWALGALRHAPAVPALRARLEERLAHDEEAFVRWVPPEVTALREIGGAGAEYLRSLLAGRSSAVRRRVAMSLAEGGDAAAFPCLVDLLDALDRARSADLQERTWVARLLARIDAPRARDELTRRSLTATDPAVSRCYAEAALLVPTAPDRGPAGR